MTVIQDNPLVDALGSVSILEPAQQQELPALVEAFPEQRTFAKELVRREWLTAFQINYLANGNGQQLLFGNYILLDKLGEGAMGQVFKAKQRNLDRIVALKLLRRECMGNARAVQRFEREIQASGKLRHPHIVRAFDADQADGVSYIAMEFIEGRDLARIVRLEGPLNAERACDYARQAALALQHALECGLVHRDVKPANFLVVADGPKPPSGVVAVGGSSVRKIPKSSWGMVKLLDLGLARWTDPLQGALTLAGSVMGTPDFIAPEQARDPHGCDIRADLYGLGCTLYFLLSGRIPFPNGTITEKLVQHQVGEPDSMAPVRRASIVAHEAKSGIRRMEAFNLIPPEVEAIVHRLMRKNPDERFQTPNELAKALEQVISGLRGEKLGDTTPMRAVTQPLQGPLPSAIIVEDFQGMVARSASRPIITGLQAPATERPNLMRWGLSTLCAFLFAGLVVGLAARNLTARSHDPSPAASATKIDKSKR